MKYLFSLLLLIGTSTDIDRIAKINKLKNEAKQAFKSGDYQSAINKYVYLLDSMKVKNHREQISLNLANAYYHAKDTANALHHYYKATESAISTIKSTAYQQQGLIEYQQKKHKQALGSFKNALKANPANENARYNYEIIKKLLKEQEKNQNQNKDNKNEKNKDKKNKDKKDKENKNKQNKNNKNKQNKEQKQDNKQENKENKKENNKENSKEKEKKDSKKKEEDRKKGKEQDNKKDKKQPQKGEENKKDKQPNNKQEQLPKGVEQKLKEMKISEEKAKMILEALKNQEVQYIQQNKKKAKKRSNNDKPDW